MLIRSTKAFRWWTAGTLALLYSFCVLAPAFAAAVSTAAAIHCLTAAHHQPAKHDAAHPHDHHGHGHHAGHDVASADVSGDAQHKDGKAASDCCGVMCMPTIPAGYAGSDAARLSQRFEAATLRHDLPGCGPSALYRPPAASLSL